MFDGILFCDVMDVMIVVSSFVVILVLVTQVNSLSCSSNTGRQLCILMGYKMTSQKDETRILTSLPPLSPLLLATLSW